MLKRPIAPSPVLDESRDRPLNPFLDSVGQSRQGTWYWWLLSLLLAIAALGQWGWLERRSLMEHPAGERALEVWCGLAGCSLPVRRDPTQVQVLSREMTALENRPDVLAFALMMKNAAHFTQPWPWLELELYGNDHKPAGKRIFSPTEYLGREPESPLMTPGQTSQGRMELKDPGAEVTGFEIRFL